LTSSTAFSSPKLDSTELIYLCFTDAIRDNFDSSNRENDRIDHISKKSLTHRSNINADDETDESFHPNYSNLMLNDAEMEKILDIGLMGATNMAYDALQHTANLVSENKLMDPPLPPCVPLPNDSKGSVSGQGIMSNRIFNFIERCSQHNDAHPNESLRSSLNPNDKVNPNKFDIRAESAIDDTVIDSDSNRNSHGSPTSTPRKPLERLNQMEGKSDIKRTNSDAIIDQIHRKKQRIRGNLERKVSQKHNCSIAHRLLSPSKGERGDLKESDTRARPSPFLSNQVSGTCTDDSSSTDNFNRSRLRDGCDKDMNDGFDVSTQAHEGAIENKLSSTVKSRSINSNELSHNPQNDLKLSDSVNSTVNEDTLRSSNTDGDGLITNDHNLVSAHVDDHVTTSDESENESHSHLNLDHISHPNLCPNFFLVISSSSSAGKVVTVTSDLHRDHQNPFSSTINFINRMQSREKTKSYKKKLRRITPTFLAPLSHRQYFLPFNSFSTQK
jgi:hypothetical protein